MSTAWAKWNHVKCYPASPAYAELLAYVGILFTGLRAQMGESKALGVALEPKKHWGLLLVTLYWHETSIHLWIAHFQTISYTLVQWRATLRVFKVHLKLYEKEIKTRRKEIGWWHFELMINSAELQWTSWHFLTVLSGRPASVELY